MWLHEKRKKKTLSFFEVATIFHGINTFLISKEQKVRTEPQKTLIAFEAYVLNHKKLFVQ